MPCKQVFTELFQPLPMHTDNPLLHLTPPYYKILGSFHTGYFDLLELPHPQYTYTTVPLVIITGLLLFQLTTTAARVISQIQLCENCPTWCDNNYYHGCQLLLHLLFWFQTDILLNYHLQHTCYCKLYDSLCPNFTGISAH